MLNDYQKLGNMVKSDCALSMSQEGPANEATRTVSFSRGLWVPLLGLLSDIDYVPEPVTC